MLEEKKKLGYEPQPNKGVEMLGEQRLLSQIDPTFPNDWRETRNPRQDLEFAV